MEIIENILFYLMDDDDTLDYLQTVPELTSMLLNYRRPTVKVTKTWTWLHPGGELFIEDFHHQQSHLNYRPKLIESDFISVCQLLDLGVDLKGIKFKIEALPYNTTEQMQRVLDNVEVYDLSIDRTVELKSQVNHLTAFKWTKAFPSDLDSLKIDHYLPMAMYPIPPTLVKLGLFDAQVNNYVLPISVTELEICETQNLHSLMDFTYLCNLNLFKFKSNVERGYMKHLLDIQLPQTIEKLALNCTKMVSLNGIEAYAKLCELTIIDCPDLILFFTPEFPPSLTLLEFSFKCCQQRLFNRNRVVFQIPGRSPFGEVKFMYANGGFVLVVEHEFKPPPLLKTLILRNHKEIYFGPKLNLPNLQTLVLEKIFKLNCGRLFSGLSVCDKLNRLTLTDSSIDCIDDVKFPKNLYKLDLSGNLLSSIRNTNLYQAKNLRVMELGRNRFTGTNNIDIPKNLQRLNLYDNELRLCHLQGTNLTKIDIALSAGVEFNWEMFPTTLMYVTMLVNGHYLKQMPNTFQSLRKLFIQSWYQPIRIQNLNFAEFPNLYYLDLCSVQPQESNDIQLPQSIVNFLLRCTTGTVCQWPDLRSYDRLKTLTFETVDFDDVDLDKLPPGLEELKMTSFNDSPVRGSVEHLLNFRVLDLPHGLTKGLPPFLITLPKSLTVLKMDYNNLAPNCADYINCPNLQLLSVYRNSLRHLYAGRESLLKFIPEMIAKCPKLRRVFVSDEDVEDFAFEQFRDIIKPLLGYITHPERWPR